MLDLNDRLETESRSHKCSIACSSMLISLGSLGIGALHGLRLWNIMEWHTATQQTSFYYAFQDNVAFLKGQRIETLPGVLGDEDDTGAAEGEGDAAEEPSTQEEEEAQEPARETEPQTDLLAIRSPSDLQGIKSLYNQCENALPINLQVYDEDTIESMISLANGVSGSCGSDCQRSGTRWLLLFFVNIIACALASLNLMCTLCGVSSARCRVWAIACNQICTVVVVLSIICTGLFRFNYRGQLCALNKSPNYWDGTQITNLWTYELDGWLIGIFFIAEVTILLLMLVCGNMGNQACCKICCRRCCPCCEKKRRKKKVKP